MKKQLFNTIKQIYLSNMIITIVGCSGIGIISCNKYQDYFTRQQDINNIKLIDKEIRNKKENKKENIVKNGYYINENIWISNIEGAVAENNKK